MLDARMHGTQGVNEQFFFAETTLKETQNSVVEVKEEKSK